MSVQALVFTSDPFFYISAFLRLTDLQTAECVCRMWYDRMNTEDQDIWKERCRMHGLSIVSHTERFIRAALRAYFPKGLDKSVSSIISNYAGPSHKKRVFPLYGLIRINSASMHIYNREPYVYVDIFSKKKNVNSIDPLNEKLWHYDPPSELPPFPYKVPLRLFINPKNGDLKTTTIQLIWNDRCVILTCAPTQLNERIGLSFENMLKAQMSKALSRGRITESDLLSAYTRVSTSRNSEWFI